MIFDTYQFNGFTGELLWNNASAIYLQSEVRKNPQTDFEKFLSTADTGSFTTEKAITGRQLWEPALPYRTYLREKKYLLNDLPKVSNLAGKTALKIISESPVSYFSNYVAPCFFQLFISESIMDMSPYKNYLKETYNTETFRTAFYSRVYWIFYFSLLLICTLIYIVMKTKILFCRIMFSIAWIYVFTLPFISVPETRHYLILAPFLLIAAAMQMKMLLMKPVKS